MIAVFLCLNRPRQTPHQESIEYKEHWNVALVSLLYMYIYSYRCFVADAVALLLLLRITRAFANKKISVFSVTVTTIITNNITAAAASVAPVLSLPPIFNKKKQNECINRGLLHNI